MTEFIDRIDRAIRRNPSLPKLAWLRKLLRTPYHNMMRMSSNGLPLKIGGAMNVRLPAEFCANELQQYETETAAAIRNWVDENPGGIFVDIGCSYGYFSCGVLFQDASATVLGIDADLPSLAVTEYVCSLAPDVGQRLELYRTLIGTDSSIETLSAATLREQTETLLSDPACKADARKTNYVNFDTKIGENQLPRISLDMFLLDRLENSAAKCLIKCDVEGAEQIVLEGASKLLAQYRPTLLISVHPQYVHKFDSSVKAIRELLEGHGYSIDIIGIDHEEHWLCQ